MARSIAAAAVTCGVAKLVPSADRYSSGPQLEYPCSTQSGNAAVSGSGNVERMSSPGAAMSLNCGSRFEKAGRAARCG